jgi:hypothetical protein
MVTQLNSLSDKETLRLHLDGVSLRVAKVRLERYNRYQLAAFLVLEKYKEYMILDMFFELDPHIWRKKRQFFDLLKKKLYYMENLNHEAQESEIEIELVQMKDLMLKSSHTLFKIVNEIADLMRGFYREDNPLRQYIETYKRLFQKEPCLYIKRRGKYKYLKIKDTI